MRICHPGNKTNKSINMNKVSITNSKKPLKCTSELTTTLLAQWHEYDHSQVIDKALSY